MIDKRIIDGIKKEAKSIQFNFLMKKFIHSKQIQTFQLSDDELENIIANGFKAYCEYIDKKEGTK